MDVAGFRLKFNELGSYLIIALGTLICANQQFGVNVYPIADG